MGFLDSLKFESKTDKENELEIDTGFAQDPEPGDFTPVSAPEKKPTRRRSTSMRTAGSSNTKLAKEVAEDLASLIEGGAVVWGMRDQCCAPVLEQQAKPIADALTAVLARNPRLLAKFADADFAVATVQIIALGRAVAPVAKAVYQNHVSKATNDEGPDDDGHVHLGNFPAFGGIERNGYAGAGTTPRADR